MKRLLIGILISLQFVISFKADANDYAFASNSLLKSGKWIKIETENTGIYEISYADLNAMGFNNPAAVCIYGEGGTARSASLTNGNQRLVEDNPPQIPVIHKNNKIYFFGRGIRTLKFNGERFEYISRNIYNNKGHYYLSDVGTPKTMTSQTLSASEQNGASLRNDGMGFIIFDDDRRMGTDRAGQKFWNVTFNECPDKTFSYKGRLPGNKVDGKYFLEASIPYIHNLNSRKDATFRLSCNGTTISVVPEKPSSYILNHILSGTLENTIQYNISVGAINEEAGNSYLDYWLMSYAKEPGEMAGVQEIIGYAASNISASGITAIKIPSGSMAIDITDPAEPCHLSVNGDKAYLLKSDKAHEVVIFNPDVAQLKITNPIDVACTNLHSHAAKDIRLLIITVPEAREYAEKIADLHRKYDKINVLVTEPQTIYNEFGAGNVDPLAIRMLAKMLYSSGSASLKNILFIGPLRSDVRNILCYDPPENFIIGFQENIGLDTDRTPALTFDYFGMTTNNIDDSCLQQYKMEIGVGWLPITDDKSGSRVVRKIEEYLKALDSANLAEFVNEFMAFSHGGDNHVHDDEIKIWNRKIDSFFTLGKVGRSPVSTLYEDLFGNDYTQAITDRLNNGKLISVYLGHTRPEAFGRMKSIYTMRDFNSLKNALPAFMYISGCEAIRPDFGETGIGCLPVTESPRGMVGTIASTRQTLSGSNANLMNYFFESLIMNEALSGSNEASITAGEAFARMKSKSSNFNELSYIYIGDPALTIPVPLRNIKASIVNNHTNGFLPGEVIVIEGNLLNYQSLPDASANGEIVAKLMAPSQSFTFPGNSSGYKGAIGDIRLMAVVDHVKGGQFKVRIPLPPETSHYLSAIGPTLSSIRLFLSAYDPTSRLAYSGNVLIPLGRPGADIEVSPADEPDATAPTVDLNFDRHYRSLSINISDDIGVIPHSGPNGGVEIFIDDVKIFPEAGNRQDMAVREKTLTIYTGKLLPGTHKARASVADICGNKSTEKALTFTIPDARPSISISSDSEYATDTIQFSIGAPVNIGLEFYILDSEGNEIYSETLTGTEITWNITQTYSGTKAPAGLFRAGVRTTDGAIVVSGYKEFVILD